MRLKDRVQRANPTDPWFTTLRILADTKGTLDQYKDILERLVAKIVPKYGAGRVTTVLLWPFNKGEVTELLVAIERLKSLISIDLGMDHLLVMIIS